MHDINSPKFNQNILVTGACGFVGSVMTTRLSEMGFNVLAVDNNSRGMNLVEISKLPNVMFLERDLTQGLQKIEDIFFCYDISAVFHFAAATGDLTRPESELNEINLGITQNIAKAIAKYDPYIPLTFPTTSLALKIPDSSYVRSKEKAMDWLMSDECELDPENLLLYRFYNNCGGYRKVGEFRKLEVHCFPRMFRALMKKESFTINGNDYDTPDGTPARDYVHVLDSVDFMIFRMVRHAFEHTFTDPSGFLCEVGRNDPHTVLQIVEMLFKDDVKKNLMIPDIDNLLEAFMSNLKIGPRRDYDCGSLSPQPTADIFSWRPLRSLETIMTDTLNSYYQRLLDYPDFLDNITPQKG